MNPQAPGGVTPPDNRFSPSSSYIETPKTQLPYPEPLQTGLPTQPTPITQPVIPPTAHSSTMKVLLWAVPSGLFLVIVSVVITWSLASSPAPIVTPKKVVTPQGPQPAQAIDVQQASNSISQDISGQDNAKDFPTNQLTDKTLGL